MESLFWVIGKSDMATILGSGPQILFVVSSVNARGHRDAAPELILLRGVITAVAFLAAAVPLDLVS